MIDAIISYGFDETNVRFTKCKKSDNVKRTLGTKDTHSFLKRAMATLMFAIE